MSGSVQVVAALDREVVVDLEALGEGRSLVSVLRIVAKRPSPVPNAERRAERAVHDRAAAGLGDRVAGRDLST